MHETVAIFINMFNKHIYHHHLPKLSSALVLTLPLSSFPTSQTFTDLPITIDSFAFSRVLDIQNDTVCTCVDRYLSLSLIILSFLHPVAHVNSLFKVKAFIKLS